MDPKLTSILKDIEDVRTFTDESYLCTSYFVIFLLFGCKEEQRGLLTTKANMLIADRQAFVMIDIDDNADAADVISMIEESIERVSDEHIEVDDLNELHLCPVIISENADSSVYIEIVEAINSYIKQREIHPMWKSFLILDTLSSNAAKWLDTITRSIRSLGDMHSCRCCVMTRKDEKGFGVAEERLLTTVLFVAFLHVVKKTHEEIGRYIGFQLNNPDELFYTAQTVFVENPVITRIFNRMSGLLERLSKHKAETQNIDMGFVQDILKSAYEKMPQGWDYVSLLPIYSVMPSEDLGDFRRRLKNFAVKHYLSFAQDDKEKKATFEQIAKGFLSSCVRAGLGIDDLVSLVGNTVEINRLSSVPIQGISIDQLPPYPGSGKHSRVISEIFGTFEIWLKRQIFSISEQLLMHYFKSDEFAALPKRYRHVRDKLEEIIADMKSIKNKRKQLETSLRLLNDPDERWLDEAYMETTREFIQHFAYMAIAKDEKTFEIELSTLLEKLYQASKGLSGGIGARSYMKLISDTCSDVNSDIAKSCVTAIGEALTFPIRVSGNFGREVSCTYVWGSDDNKLYNVWEKFHTIIDTNSVCLPIKSNERFAFLRVSTSFRSSLIKGVFGKDGCAGDERDNDSNDMSDVGGGDK